MTTKERLLAALSWEKPDKVPLTVYEMLFPRGEACRLVRNAGVGLIYRPPSHREAYRAVEIQTREYWEKGIRRIRRTIRTPVGEVWQTLEPDIGGYGTSNWIKEHFIKKPEDYRVMEYYIKDPVYHNNFDELNELIRRIGDDGLVYVRIAKSPIQEMLYQHRVSRGDTDIRKEWTRSGFETRGNDGDSCCDGFDPREEGADPRS